MSHPRALLCLSIAGLCFLVSSAPGQTLPLNKLGHTKAPGTFVHPGLMHSQQDLDRLKANVNVEPYKSAYAAFASSNYSNYKNTGQGPFTYETYGHGQFEIRNDSAIVHYNAIQYAITGNIAYLNNAVHIMNEWAATLTAFDVTDHITAGTAVFDFANGAEIIRATGNGAWAPADVAKFQVWLTTYLLPPLLTPGNSIAAAQLEAANHGGIQMKGLITMGVFCECADIFNFAVASFLHNANYTYGLQEYVEPVSGQNYENQRDQGHASGAIGSFSQIAYVAYNQGVDLFATADDLLLKATEAQAKFDLSYDVAPVVWLAKDGSYHGAFNPQTRQVAENLEPDLTYHVYHDLKHLQMPYTRMMADLRYPYGSNTYGSFNYRVYTSPNAPAPVDYGDTVAHDVELFGDGGYAGYYLAHFGPGTYTSAMLYAAGASRASASSIKIPAGWTVTLYSADNFKARSVTLDSNTKFLGDVGGGFNDATYSMTVSATGGRVGGPVTLFLGKNYTGKSATITPGTYSTQQLIALGIPNDQLASIHVPTGYVVYLAGGSTVSNVGYTERLIGDSPDVSADSVSSILVTGHAVTDSTQLADGTYRIENARWGRVAGTGNAEVRAGTRVEQFLYTGAPSLLWKLHQTSVGGYTFTNYNDNLLMDADLTRHATGDGAPAIQSTTANIPTQHWLITPNTAGTTTITNAGGLGNVLEVSPIAYWDYAPLTLGQNTNDVLNQWTFPNP